MPANTPRQDLIRESSVKIMDLNLEPWPLDANEAATSGHGERGPGRLHVTWHVTLSVCAGQFEIQTQ
jgi:hypothetical protein